MEQHVQQELHTQAQDDMKMAVWSSAELTFHNGRYNVCLLVNLGRKVEVRALQCCQKDCLIPDCRRVV